MVAELPRAYGMVTSISGTTLLSAVLPNGQVVNWHSAAPNDDLARQVASDISSGSVLPVMTQ